MLGLCPLSLTWLWYQTNQLYCTCNLCTRLWLKSGESSRWAKAEPIWAVWCNLRKPDCSFCFSWDCSSNTLMLQRYWGVEQALFHTVAEEQWVYTVLFILIFLLSYIMGTVKKWSMSFFLSFKAVDEFGMSNMQRFNAFPRARYNVNRWCASFHMQSCQCTFRLDLQPFCYASLCLWAYHQLLRGNVCVCTCAYDKRCCNFLIWSYIYSEPGLEWDTDLPWSRNLLGA